MYKTILLLLIISIWGCSKDTPQNTNLVKSTSTHLIPEWDSLLSNYKLTGKILVNIDSNWYSNTTDSISHLPASTFKIPHTIIALQTGAVKDTNHIFVWDKQPKFLRSWEQDMNLSDAFRRSCLPCYQQLAPLVGVDSMKKYTQLWEYGNMDIRTDSISLFWIAGESTISPKNQIQFIQKIIDQNLLIDKKIYPIMKNIMKLPSEKGYDIYAKTGWSIVNNKDYGWFVGYMEKENEEPIIFATFLERNEEFDRSKFGEIRKKITLEAISIL